MVLALWSRMRGIDYLLPQNADPLRYLVTQAEYLWEGGDPKSAPMVFHWYPSLMAHVLALTPRPSLHPEAAADLSLQLRDAGASILRTRYLVAVLSLLAIPGTWLVARAFLGPWPSLMAAAFVATSFLEALYSSQARLHAVQASLAVLTLAAMLGLRRRPTLGAYALVAVFCALTIGTLHNGFFVLPALAMAHFLREDKRPRDWTKLLLVAFALIPTILYFYPFFLSADSADEYAYSEWTLRDTAVEMGPQRVWIEQFNGQGFPRMLGHMWNHDPVLLVFFALGCACLVAGMLRRRSAAAFPRTGPGKDALVLAAHGLPYLAVTGMYSTTFARFLLPLYPYIACFAAFGIDRLAAFCSRAFSWRHGPTFAGLATLALAFPCYAVWKLAEVRHAPDTMEQAAAWLLENVDPSAGPILVSPYLQLPLFNTAESLEEALDFPSNRTGAPSGALWLLHQEKLPPNEASARTAFDLRTIRYRPRVSEQFADFEKALGYLNRTGARYAVLVADMGWEETFPPLGKIHDALKARGEVVARFSPRDTIEIYRPASDYQEPPKMLPRYLWARALGPPIEIYRLGG